jgi:HEAT repeat protein
LQSLLPQLAELTRHTDHRVRADACHLLGLSGSAAARPYLEACIKDSSEEVREIASESLQLLETA